jgi:ABC-type multidrug transport system permease subunit
MPYFGLNPEYGSFIWVGTIVTMAFFESIYGASDLVNDFENDKVIEYSLVLPISAPLVFIKTALSISLDAAVLSIFLVPLGKILLMDRLALHNFSIIKFIIIFMSMNLFFGFFALWIASWAKNGKNFSYVYRRVVNPIWIFGGYQFTWLVLYKAFPQWGLLLLCNPLTYAFEGLRSAILGPVGYINFWACVGALWLFTIIFAYWSLRWMKQRLDYI